MICSTCRTALQRTARPSTFRTLSTLRLSTPLRSLTTTTKTTLRPAPFNPTLSQAFPSRTYTTSNPETSMSPAEASIAATLSTALSPTHVLVQDISGGCGSMYAIDITSSAFKGLNMLKQQRLVNKALGEEIKSWHGVQIKTRVPEEA